jgi:hypothetical protein
MGLAGTVHGLRSAADVVRAGKAQAFARFWYRPSPKRTLSAPILPSDESAALRDRLLGAIAGLQSQESATNWAQGALAAKNRLNAQPLQMAGHLEPYPLPPAWWVGTPAYVNGSDHLRADPRHAGIGRWRQFVIRQPTVIFFSAAYFAAASLTMGAIMESSAVIQSDAMFHFLPSQVWMRPVRVPSWSAQDTLIGCSSFSNPSWLRRSAVRSRFSSPHLTCSPVNGFLTTNRIWQAPLRRTAGVTLATRNSTLFIARLGV